jgi:hypothetical protein
MIKGEAIMAKEKSERTLFREVTLQKRADAWQQVQAEDAAAAKAEAAKTARLRELRLAKEAADAANAPALKPKRSRAKMK